MSSEPSPRDRDEAMHSYVWCSNPSMLFVWPEGILLCSVCSSPSWQVRGSHCSFNRVDCKLNPRVVKTVYLGSGSHLSLLWPFPTTGSGFIVPISRNNRHTDIKTLKEGQMLVMELGMPHSRVWVLPSPADWETKPLHAVARPAWDLPA